MKAAVLAVASVAMMQGALAQDAGRVKIERPEDKVDIKGAPPPQGAVVLFDGSGLDRWGTARGKLPARWPVAQGAMEARGGAIVTRQNFEGYFRLHLEFRIPKAPRGADQEHTAGVYLQGRYKVQIFDSYGADSQEFDCGAIYGLSAPLVNACKAPSVWQSFDIDFRSPRCRTVAVGEWITLPPHLGMGRDIEFFERRGERLEKTGPAIMTVYHNGKLIQEQVAIADDNMASGLGGDVCRPGPIMLEGNGSHVQFRNIWLARADAFPAQPAPAAAQPVYLTIRTTANAELWIAGVKVAGQGTERRPSSRAIPTATKSGPRGPKTAGP
jgi:hypothetical protein